MAPRSPQTTPWATLRKLAGQARAGVAAGGDDVAQKVAALMDKRAQVKADLARLDASGETQLSRTDADARLLSKRGQTVAGYNVQIAVDDKHKLIVASEVVNDGNDTGQQGAPPDGMPVSRRGAGAHKDRDCRGRQGPRTRAEEPGVAHSALVDHPRGPFLVSVPHQLALTRALAAN